MVALHAVDKNQMTNWYCPLPFKHAYIDSGGIAPCCRTARQQTTLIEWPNNPNLKKIQQEILAGQVPTDCNLCVSNEQEYGASLRTDSIRDYNNQRFDSTDIDFIDFRSVNICNFKCRSCDPVFSHKIAQEINRAPELKSFFYMVPETKTASVTDVNIEWVLSNLGSLKRIMLTGGEPTVIPGVRELLKTIQKNYPDIQVLITSNVSFQDNFWFEITKQLPNLHWTVSVDAVGPSAEIVRHGSVWPIIEHNVAWLAQNARSLDINSVVSNLTIFSLRPLLDFGRQMQKLSMPPTGRHGDQGCRHQFFVCERPRINAVDNLSENLLSDAQKYLKSCIALDLNSEQANMLNGVIEKIKSAEFDPELWERSETYNNILDSIRNENHLVLFEEQL